MKVYAHTLVKNDARWLWYAVSSVINHVDKVLLWDAGSSDESLIIEKELIEAYPSKIEFRQREQNTIEDFKNVRQEMLDATNSDWFIVVDADEIWYEESIKGVIEVLKSSSQNIESVVVPTINLVGDIFHYQNSSAGRYRFGNRVGHYNLRAVKRTIPGLHSQGIHGIWGWADNENKMIQDRGEDRLKFVDLPYLHTTFLQRSTNRIKDLEVIKRSKKLKYEFGESFPKDFYYPEVFFKPRPKYIYSPWHTMSSDFKFRASLETPLRILKRKIWWGRAGY